MPLLVRPPREGAEIVDVRTGRFTALGLRFFNSMIELLNSAGGLSEGAIAASLFSNNTILKADLASNPLALTVGSNRVVGRAASGGIAALTPEQLQVILGFGAIGLSIAEAELPEEVRDLLLLGTLALQDGDDVAITGGSIVNITDLAVSDGGTGASTAPAARANLGSRFARVATQFDATDATLADVTELVASVEAGKTYDFTARLFVDADATGGHKYAIGGTATATSIIYEIMSLSNAAALAITSRQTALGGSAGEAGATSVFTEIKGLIMVANAGNLSVQFAQNSANGTSSVLPGSSLTINEVA